MIAAQSSFPPSGSYPNEFGEQTTLMRSTANELATTLPEPGLLVGWVACAGLLAILGKWRSGWVLLPLAMAASLAYVGLFPSKRAFLVCAVLFAAGVVRQLFVWRAAKNE